MIYRFEDCELNTDVYTFSRAGEAQRLEPKVFDLLTYLIQHRDRVIHKDELLAELWPGHFVSEATLNSSIMTARRAVGDNGREQTIIKTLRRRGYRFVAEVGEHPTEAAPAPTPEPTAGHEDVITSPQEPEQPLFGHEHSVSERKPVTALSCALDDMARELAASEPDTFHDITRQLFELSLIEIERYGGTITQFLEDGFFALFGASMVHEDHARRAVLAALAIQRHFYIHMRMAQSTMPHAPTSTPPAGRPLDLRIGLHTGRVLVSRVGEDVRLTSTAIEGTNDWAIACQRQATPGTILVSEAMKSSIQDIVRLRKAETIEGMQGGEQTYQVLAYEWRHSSQSRWASDGLNAFVGRKRELETLEALLDDVRAGRGQVVGIVGEPGMGKSRLLYEFQHRLDEHEVVYCEGHCVSYGDATPYLPLRDALRQAWEISVADPPDTIEHRVKEVMQRAGMGSDEEVAYLMHLLSVPGNWPSLAGLSPEAIKTRTFHALRQICLGRSQHQPVIIAVEDLHWIDATSEEFLASLVEYIAGAPILVLTTYRQGYQPKWMTKSYATQIALTRLSYEASRQVVEEAPRHAPPTEVLAERILHKADGNPFFLEELARVMTDRDGETHPETIPDTIQAVLAARIDRLNPSEKQVLQTAAVIGKHLPYALLRLVTNLPDDQLNRYLMNLQAAEFIHVRRDVQEHAYTFKHVLIQEVAYQSLLERSRQELHERIAHVLETALPDTVAAEPELLAHHYTKAKMTEPAINAWYRAGRHAMAHSAYIETIAHLKRGLTLLEDLPETSERSQLALSFHMSLGPSLMAIKGYASHEVEAVYAQAQVLCERIGDMSQRFVTLWGLCGLRLLQADLKRAHDISQEQLDIAQSLGDALALQRAHFSRVMLLFNQGELASAKVHIDRGLAIDEGEQRRGYRDIQHPRVGCLTYDAIYLWLRGDADQAVAQVEAALVLARQLQHPMSETFALVHAAVIYQFRQQGSKVLTMAEAAIQLASEQGFAYFFAAATILRGWATMASGNSATGSRQMQEGLAAYQATGAELNMPYFLALLADGHRQLRQVETGLNLVGDALTRVQHTGECWWEAELYRLEGELMLQQGGRAGAAAETRLHQAANLARQRGTKAIELRASVSLGRIWQSQGKALEARRMIEALYEDFTEGAETPDMQAAKQLRDECATDAQRGT